MSGVVAYEGELNSMVKEYLSYHGFDKAVRSFEAECAEKGTPVASVEVRPKTSQQLTRIQQEMMQHFENGRAPEFFNLWMKHLPQEIRDNDSMASRLEFLLNVYFTIFPFRAGTQDKEKAITRFRRYLETRGNQLSKTPEFISYSALAFVSDPREVPSYDNLFSDTWTRDVHRRMDKFLNNSLLTKPSPRLVELLDGNGKGRDVQQLEQRAKNAEKTLSFYRKQCSKVQTDYYNLIDVAANLVETLESYIQGNSVDYTYISKICSRLFSSNVLQTVDFSRPGTAAKTLRETVPSHHVQGQSKKDTNANQNFDFNKMKMDLGSASEQRKALLLQALRWKLTKSTYSERVAMLSLYRSNDIIGCSASGPHKQAVLSMVNGESILLRQSIARLLNTISSSWEGRGYLSLSKDLVLKLIKGVQNTNQDPVAKEHILACLQKLSLRSNIRPTMVDEGLITWLVTSLRGFDGMSDYMLEYAVALLMNLTILSYGRNRCISLGSQLLKIISRLLGHENSNIKPFVHGTLYSLLRVPSIAEEAQSMGMEDILKSSVKDEDEEEKKHVLFLIKRLKNLDDDDKLNESDDDDDDDDDDVYEEDQDELERDLDKDDTLKPQGGELSGNQFLAKYYSLSETSNSQQKRVPFDSMLISDDIFRRPMTPNYIRSTTTERHPTVAEISAARASYQSAPPGSRSQRPPTRSGSRPSSRDEFVAKMAPPRQVFERQKTPDHPFASRPKVLRTPDLSGRPLSRNRDLTSPLQPKYSESLPRPGSGGRPSSQASSQVD